MPPGWSCFTDAALVIVAGAGESGAAAWFEGVAQLAAGVQVPVTWLTLVPLAGTR